MGETNAIPPKVVKREAANHLPESENDPSSGGESTAPATESKSANLVASINKERAHITIIKANES